MTMLNAPDAMRADVEIERLDRMRVMRTLWRSGPVTHRAFDAHQLGVILRLIEEGLVERDGGGFSLTMTGCRMVASEIDGEPIPRGYLIEAAIILIVTAAIVLLV